MSYDICILISVLVLVTSKLFYQKCAHETMKGMIKILNTTTDINYNTLLIHSIPSKRKYLYFILHISIIQNSVH